jgi:hypothetical protein
MPESGNRPGRKTGARRRKGPDDSPGDSAVETTQGSETSQYLEEEKSNEIPLVVASERGIAQTVPACRGGVAGLVRFRAGELPTIG